MPKEIASKKNVAEDKPSLLAPMHAHEAKQNWR